MHCFLHNQGFKWCLFNGTNLHSLGIYDCNQRQLLFWDCKIHHHNRSSLPGFPLVVPGLLVVICLFCVEEGEWKMKSTCFTFLFCHEWFANRNKACIYLLVLNLCIFQYKTVCHIHRNIPSFPLHKPIHQQRYIYPINNLEMWVFLSNWIRYLNVKMNIYSKFSIKINISNICTCMSNIWAFHTSTAMPFSQVASYLLPLGKNKVPLPWNMPSFMSPSYFVSVGNSYFPFPSILRNRKCSWL